MTSDDKRFLVVVEINGGCCADVRLYDQTEQVDFDLEIIDHDRTELDAEEETDEEDEEFEASEETEEHQG